MNTTSHIEDTMIDPRNTLRTTEGLQITSRDTLTHIIETNMTTLMTGNTNSLRTSTTCHPTTEVLRTTSKLAADMTTTMHPTSMTRDLTQIPSPAIGPSRTITRDKRQNPLLISLTNSTIKENLITSRVNRRQKTYLAEIKKKNPSKRDKFKTSALKIHTTSKNTISTNRFKLLSTKAY